MIDDDITYLLQTMRGITVPSAAEERVLLKAAKDGDTEARKELVWRNMPLVIKEAARMVRNHNAVSSHSKAEIMQSALSEGSMGLCRAIAAFDLKRGNKFSTYAMWHIRESIRRALVFDKNSIKPIRTLERARDVKINITMMSFLEDFDKEQSEQEELNESLHKQMVIAEMKRAMDDILTKKEKYILLNRYGFSGTELTYSDMAKVLGLSTERVRQIENNALRKMWAHLQQNEIQRWHDENDPVSGSFSAALAALQSRK